MNVGGFYKCRKCGMHFIQDDINFKHKIARGYKCNTFSDVFGLHVNTYISNETVQLEYYQVTCKNCDKKNNTKQVKGEG